MSSARRSKNSSNLYPKKNQINTNIHNKNKNFDFCNNSFGLSFGKCEKKSCITLIEGIKGKTLISERPLNANLTG